MYNKYTAMADELEKLASECGKPTLEDVAAASLLYLDDCHEGNVMGSESMQKVADERLVSDLAFEYGMAIVMNAVTNIS